ncbi:unnamed protein product [Blepharisma stoltei]|uniref:Uncharacterized protein n=1 Tax=Blepharisma stoltei TaxID=1481888 RepID=A0AAU9JQ43_9CILI|nr:unnamed protein product [Blepharisma stoltei]
MWKYLLVLGLSFAADPIAPHWPNTFTQTFNETFWSPSYGKQVTNGTYYYDWTTQNTRVDRANGRFDPMCGLNGFKILVNSPCTLYTVGGNRYIYYPDDPYCCWCCSDQTHCGSLYPTWMDNGTFLGTTTKNGVPAYWWNKEGSQPNYYYETAATDPSKRVMLGIFEVPSDEKNFNSNIVYSVPNGIFNLPSICVPSNVCPEASICTQLREAGNKTTSDH